MTNWKLYSAIACAFIIILSLYGYQRYAVITCTEKAVEAVKKQDNRSYSEDATVYDVVFKVCMGRKGLER